MPKTKRRSDGITKLRQLARLFAAELRSRDWGRDEYDKLLGGTRASGEKIDEDERWLTRWSLAAIDRVGSIVVAAAGCVEFASASNRPIPRRVLWDVLRVLHEQAVRATGDVHAAQGAIEWKPDLPKARLGFAEAVTALGQRMLAAPTARHPRVRPVVRVLREVLATTTLMERSIATVDRLVVREEEARRRLDPAAVAQACRFIGQAANHARDVLTLVLPRAIEIELSGRKKSAKRLRVTRARKGR